MSDHVTAAKGLLDHLENEAMDASTAAGVVGVAQVHATLALVEQQRTANLVAYLAITTSLLETGTVDPAGLNRIAAAAWEGLGLA